METFLAIILLIGITLIIFGSTMNFKSSVSDFIIGSGITMVIIMFLTLIIYNNTSVPAIDVYRGKTTLEITYKDSIPIDSVVVYKNK